MDPCSGGLRSSSAALLASTTALGTPGPSRGHNRAKHPHVISQNGLRVLGFRRCRARGAINRENMMKKLFSALWLVSTLAMGAASAQPYAPNDAGATNGHWHLNSRDVAANKHIFLAMGGTAIGPGERVQFPGVLVILNQGPNTPPLQEFAAV